MQFFGALPAHPRVLLFYSYFLQGSFKILLKSPMHAAPTILHPPTHKSPAINSTSRNYNKAMHFN